MWEKHFSKGRGATDSKRQQKKCKAAKTTYSYCPEILSVPICPNFLWITIATLITEYHSHHYDNYWESHKENDLQLEDK